MQVVKVPQLTKTTNSLIAQCSRARALLLDIIQHTLLRRRTTSTRRCARCDVECNEALFCRIVANRTKSCARAAHWTATARSHHICVSRQSRNKRMFGEDSDRLEEIVVVGEREPSDVSVILCRLPYDTYQSRCSMSRML